MAEIMRPKFQRPGNVSQLTGMQCMQDAVGPEDRPTLSTCDSTLPKSLGLSP
jgi:hypothetical protein